MNFLNNISIKTKMITGAIIMALFIAGTGFFAENKLEEVSDYSNRIYNNNLIPISEVSNILDEYNLLRITLATLIATEDYDIKSTLKREIFSNIDNIKANFTNSEKYKFTINEKKDFDSITEKFILIENKYKEIIELEEQFMTSDANEIFYNVALTLERDSKILLKKILSNKTIKSEEMYKEVHYSKNSALNIINFIILISVILAVIISSLITISILKSIKKIVYFAKQVSKGNFDIDLERTDDEIGDISDALSLIIETLNNFNKQYSVLISAVSNENYNTRCDLNNFDGSYKKMLSISNDLMTILENKITEQIESSQKTERNANYQRIEIEKIQNLLKKFGKGDFSVSYTIGISNGVSERVERNFKNIQESLNIALDSLNVVISSSISVANQVNISANQLADASQTLSTGAINQAASLEEISSSMIEIESSVKDNSNLADKANNLSQTAITTGDKGTNAMSKLVESMDELNNSSTKIRNIIKVIDDIAFQTNLLALNAAVEAARAGKHGKGFAVVADEVRNLASRSAKAANETSEMIDISVSNTSEGSQLVDNTSDILNQIVNENDEISSILSNITQSIKNQSEAMKQINITLDQVNNIVQTNSSTSEETAAASQEMSSQASKLINQLGHFKLRESRLDDNHNEKVKLIE